MAEVAAQPGLPAREAIALLEQWLAEDPDNLFLAKALFEVYGRIEDPAARNRAWQELLAKEPAMPDVYRARLHLALAEAAEREGDLPAALELIEKAARLDRSPKARVEQLVVQARVLLARGDHQAAGEKVAEAVELNPESTGALALAAELHYRAQDWEKARDGYRRLAALPDAGAAVPRATLASRRAELAEMFGDQVEAEAAYRELVAMQPDNDVAREALAGFALLRGELAEATMHLQEVVRLLPKESVDRLTQVRQRLGQAYLGLGDLQAARANLELTLASEPERASTLELLATAYARLGMYRDAATMCERLSRVLAEPARKAEALFRQGEILRTSLGDPEGASEAYLRASDHDPGYAPPLARLVAYYWGRAELVKLADVGGDLVQASPTPKVDQSDLGLLVTIAALLGHHDEALAKLALESTMLGSPVPASVAAARLGELIGRVARGSLESLDEVLAFLFSAMPPSFADELGVALQGALASDPGDAGQAMVLGRLFERRGAVGLARSAYSVALFVDPGLGAEQRLAELGEASTPRLAAFAADTAVHPLCRVPLRRVLHHLAAALASAGPSVHGGLAAGLQPETLALSEALRSPMGAPPIPLVAQGHGADVTFSASQPLCILVGRRAEALPTADLRFLARPRFRAGARRHPGRAAHVGRQPAGHAPRGAARGGRVRNAVRAGRGSDRRADGALAVAAAQAGDRALDSGRQAAGRAVGRCRRGPGEPTRARRLHSWLPLHRRSRGLADVRAADDRVAGARRVAQGRGRRRAAYRGAAPRADALLACHARVGQLHGVRRVRRPDRGRVGRPDRGELRRAHDFEPSGRPAGTNYRPRSVVRRSTELGLRTPS